jgi:phosphate acetyltransferase
MEIQEAGNLLHKNRLPMIGAIPNEPELLAPRTLDVAHYLQARVLHAGQISRRRVRSMAVTARTVPNVVHLLKPGALIVTAGDREDIVLGTSMAAMNGVPLAGLLLTCDSLPDPRIQQLCHQAFTSGLPVMSTTHNTFETASFLSNMSRQVPADDLERMERVIDFVAEHLDADKLKRNVGAPREHRMPPPAFRYQLMEKARRAGKRIVLPEGNEPRTVKAAAICQEKGIAHCVLIGNRAEIEQIAEAQGVTLPAFDRNPRSQRSTRQLHPAHGGTAQGQGPERTDGRAAAGRQCGAGHHDAGAGRSGRPGIRRGTHHRQHHPPCPAADQDRTGSQAGFQRVLHADAGTGAGLW